MELAGWETKEPGRRAIPGQKGRVNHIAVVITGFAAFGLSLVWYSPLLFGGVWMKFRSAPQGPPDWTFVLAPLRELTAAYVIAILLARLGISDWKRALGWMFLLWVAFHAVGMTGAVLWDSMPWQLGAVHAGDWLMKMVFMAGVIHFWPRRKENA